MWKLFAYEKTIGHGRKTLIKKNNNQKKKKKNRPKEERQCTILSQHNKNYFMKATH